jgi:hypothetical protein
VITTQDIKTRLEIVEVLLQTDVINLDMNDQISPTRVVTSTKVASKIETEKARVATTTEALTNGKDRRVAFNKGGTGQLLSMECIQEVQVDEFSSAI